MRASGGQMSFTSWPRRMRPCDSERMRISCPPQPREDSVWTMVSGVTAFSSVCALHASGKTWSVPDLAGAVDVAVPRRPGGLRELQFVEPGVEAALREQLGVAADLGDAT